MVGAKNIVLNGFVWTALHQRNMLVGRSVKHHLWPVLFKDLIHTGLIPHRADFHPQIQPISVYPHQFLLDIIGVIFVDIQYNQSTWMAHGNLPAQLTADGTAAPGHHHHLILQKVRYHRFVQLYRGSSQQILYLNIFHRREADLTVEHLVQTGEHPKATTSHLTDIENLCLLVRRYGGNCKNDLCNAILLNSRLNLFSTAHNPHAI